MPSLRFRILLAFIGTITLLSTALGFWHYRHLRDLVTRSFTADSQVFAHLIARQAVAPLFAEDAAALERLASQALALPSLHGIAFWTAEGRLLQAFPAGDLPFSPFASTAIALDDLPAAAATGRGVLVRAPVMLATLSPEGVPTGPLRRIGEVSLWFTLDDLTRELASIRNTVVMAEALFALVAGLLVFTLERWATRPLIALIEKIRGIAEGDLSIRVEVPTRGGEITTLCQSVNQMADALQRHTASLERSLAERTAALDKLQALMDNMSNGVMVCRPLPGEEDFLIEELNRAAAGLGHLARDQAIGQPVTHLLPGLRPMGLLEAMRRVAREGRPEHIAEARYGDDRTQGWWEIFLYRLPSGEVVTVVADITERKSAEEAWRRFNAELDQRVRDRTAQLEAANRELEAFSYSVSHDLRAPLRGIDGWSVALLEDCAAGLDERGRQYLGRVRAEAQRMGLLIDELLQLSRVTRSKLEPTTVDLSALAQKVADRLREAHPDRQLEFLIAPGLQARGDPLLLEIVLTNLLDNACKFTRPRSPARIEFRRLDPAIDTDLAAGPTTRSDSEWPGHPGGPIGRPDPATLARVPVFLVRDNGVGFDMAYAGKLFGAFQRLHRSSEFPGTGIGLATVARIIHRHGGRVWGESRPDAGATFYFTLGEPS
ncbi:MAG: Sensory box histidine kinase [Candidatus Ozemobacter sibiricus]|jgi:signal transduction histidine kinase|uniref:histidine kinase n=1 Tax=Candidatus Ozemobacter sibiricus TaxID=2268124 RepID=A0A367ZV12_9BACT|nr:MAG: Sensory box histidine kinase [Candidatus Ozemobacter sibiricus]